MKRDLRWYDLITVNIYFLGLTTVAQTNGLIFPLLIQQFVGEADKGAYLGVLRLWSLMAALLLQSVWGILSDRTIFRFGRRRPYILGGTLASMVFFAAIGFSAGLSGMTGFWFLFFSAILMQVSSNAGQAAQQAFIPDLVPENQRGKFSSIKSIFELPLPLILVSFTIGRLISHGQMWTGIFVATAVLLASMLVAMFVPEKPLQETPAPFDWKPFLRLALMAGVFTILILVVGGAIRLLGKWLTELNSFSMSILVMSAAGLVAMLIAVGLGVWLSVRLSIGPSDARKNPAFTWWVINRLAFLVGAVNISVFAIYFLQARLGYVREQAAGPAAQLLMVVGIFILLSALPAGWLADRFGRRQLVAFSGFLAAGGTLIALLIPNLGLIFVGSCLIGIGAGFFYTVNWALGTDIVPREQAARYLGISNLAGAGAGAVGAYIGGPIADYFTSASNAQGLGYVVLFAIYGTLFLFSALVVSQVKKKAAK
jgi:MFS family permease